MGKLNKNQQKALQILSIKKGEWVRLWKFGIRSQTGFALVRRGLVEHRYGYPGDLGDYRSFFKIKE